MKTIWELELKFPLTTYVARHTYAMVLKNSSVDINKKSVKPYSLLKL